LCIDLLVVKKAPGAVIRKNIAEIFRGVNLIEYKSPTDYLALGDFHRTLSYAHLYMALNGTDIADMTLTFVESRRPGKLVGYLREKLGYDVEERVPGIYTVDGYPVPIQVIDGRRLSPESRMIAAGGTATGISGRKRRRYPAWQNSVWRERRLLYRRERRPS